MIDEFYASYKRKYKTNDKSWYENEQSKLNEYISKSVEERQVLQDKIKEIDKDMQILSNVMEQVHTVKKYRVYYEKYKANPSDKAFLKRIRLKSHTTKRLLQN